MTKKKTSITLDNGTLKDLDEMAKSTRRSRSSMIGVLVDLFKFTVGRAVEEFDEDGNEIPHSQGDMRHCTITLYLDEKKATKLSDLATSTGRTKSELISFLIDWIRPGVKRGDIIVDRNGNDTPQDD